MISEINSLEEARELSMNILKAKEFTFEQKTSQLAKLAENLNPFPKNAVSERLLKFQKMADLAPVGRTCTLCSKIHLSELSKTVR